MKFVGLLDFTSFNKKKIPLPISPLVSIYKCKSIYFVQLGSIMRIF